MSKRDASTKGKDLVEFVVNDDSEVEFIDESEAGESDDSDDERPAKRTRKTGESSKPDAGGNSGSTNVSKTATQSSAKSATKASNKESKATGPKGKAKGAQATSKSYATRRQTFEYVASSSRASTMDQAALVQMENLQAQVQLAERNAETRASQAKQKVLELELKVKQQEQECFDRMTPEERTLHLKNTNGELMVEKERAEARALQAQNKALKLQADLVEKENELQQSKNEFQRLGVTVEPTTELGIKASTSALTESKGTTKGTTGGITKTKGTARKKASDAMDVDGESDDFVQKVLKDSRKDEVANQKTDLLRNRRKIRTQQIQYYASLEADDLLELADKFKIPRTEVQPYLEKMLNITGFLGLNFDS